MKKPDEWENKQCEGADNILNSESQTNPELLDSLTTLPNYRKDIFDLEQVFEALFGTRDLGNYCCYTDAEKACSDGSDLYTLIKYEGRDLIVKVGCGEFNTKVFTTGNNKELKGFYKSPIPLFVVNQWDSHWGDNEQKKLRGKNPKEYLDKYAVLVSPKWWEAYGRSRVKDKEPLDYTNIHIKHYEDALSSWRLALLQKTFPNQEFTKATRLLTELKELDFERFYSRTAKGEKYASDEEKKLLGCLRKMWVNTCGSAVGDKDAYQSLYDLIQTLDVHTFRH